MSITYLISNVDAEIDIWISKGKHRPFTDTSILPFVPCGGHARHLLLVILCSCVCRHCCWFNEWKKMETPITTTARFNDSCERQLSFGHGTEQFEWSGLNYAQTLMRSKSFGQILGSIPIRQVFEKWPSNASDLKRNYSHWNQWMMVRFGLSRRHDFHKDRRARSFYADAVAFCHARSWNAAI